MKVAIIVLADTETHESLGRVVNALEAVKELKEGGDDVQLVFDGAGTKWVVELSHPEHKAHALYEAVEDKVSGVCSFCATAFGVHDAISACDSPLVDDYDGHPSFRKMLSEGYQIITF